MISCILKDRPEGMPHNWFGKTNRLVLGRLKTGYLRPARIAAYDKA